MKRIVLFFVLLSFLHKSGAQVIINESFENVFPPAGWSRTVIGNGDEWEQGELGTGVNGGRAIFQFSNDKESDAWIFSKGVALTAGVSYKLSYWGRAKQVYGSSSNYLVTLGKEATPDSQTQILRNSVMNSQNYVQRNETFTVQASGNYHFAFHSTILQPNTGIEIDSVILEQLSGTACSSMPPVPAITGVNTICPDSSFTLSLSGGTAAGGIGYQWQVSEAGQNNFTNITGGSGDTYTGKQRSNKDYRCVLTCIYSGLSVTTAIKNINSPAFCYCLSYANCTGNEITSVNFAGINNSSGCSPDGYGDYTTITGSTAAGATIPISVTSTNIYKKGIACIDFNQNGIFENEEYFGLGSANGNFSGSISIPSTALIGNTRLRIIVTTSISYATVCNLNGAGETEDYTINITPFVCSGTPPQTLVSGTIDRVCNDDPVKLGINGSFPGISFQWEWKDIGAGDYVPIPGATAQSLSIAVPSDKQFRCRLTCTASGLSTPSYAWQVRRTNNCYCGIVNDCSGPYGITSISFGGISNNNACTMDGDFTASVATASITAGTTVPVSVAVTPGYSSSVGVWIDLDHNNSFDAGEFKLLSSSNQVNFSGNIFIPSTTLSGTTRMRIKRRVATGLILNTEACSFFNGETEDYLVNILPAPVAIHFTAFKDTLYDVSRTLRARIVQKDVGLNNTDDFKPRVWARKQGSTGWKSFKGNLANGTLTDGEWDFDINHDSLNIRRNGCDSVQFYFVAQDVNTPFKLGYLPEAGTLHLNVATQLTAPAVPFGYRLKPRLKDTVYVGGGNCRYASLTSERGLFQEIRNRKLEGDLTIVVEQDMMEFGDHGLAAADLNGYRLSIRPSGPVIKTLDGNYPNALISFNGLKNVTIDGSYNGTGRYLRIQNKRSGTSDSVSVISIRNGCDSITLKNIIFRSDASGEGPGEYNMERTIELGRGSNKNITISNNLFTNLNASITFSIPYRFITSVTGNNNVTIKNNEFTRFYVSAIKMYGNCSNWTIDSNHFYNLSQPVLNYGSSELQAISVKGGGHIITNNFIGGTGTFCSGMATNPRSSDINLIYVGPPATMNPVIIANNRIDNIVMNNGRADYFYGISSENNHALIHDNIIGSAQGPSYTVIPWANYMYGIFASGYAEVKDNIVANISLKEGEGSQYTYMGMTGIGLYTDTAYKNLFNLPNTIYNNQVFNFRSPAGAGGLDAKTIGISLRGGYNNVIEKNTIHHIQVAEGVLQGIALTGGEGNGKTTVQKNRLYNFTNTQPTINASGYLYGIYLMNVFNNVDLVNNQVSIYNDNLARPVPIYGIYHYSNGSFNRPASLLRMLYNSVYLGGTSNLTATSSCVYLTANINSNQRKLYNNLLVNERTGGSGGNYALSLASSVSNPPFNELTADNNAYIVNDTASFMAMQLPFFNHQPKPYSYWRNNFNNNDNASYAVNASAIASGDLFLGKLGGNLNINVNDSICWFVNDKGKPFAQVADDYDAGNVRSTNDADGPTDIGSDEFFTPVAGPGELALCNPLGNTTLQAGSPGSIYQWQVSADSINFTNIIDNANYTGSNTATLALMNIPSAMYGTQYRCLVDGQPGNVSTIRFVNRWEGNVSNEWENPQNWSCGTVPDINTDVIISSGTVLLSSDTSIRNLTLMPGVTMTIAAGVNLTVTH